MSMRDETFRKIIREELSAMEDRKMPELLTQKELSVALSISESTLATWRSKGLGPEYIKVVGAVRYKKSAVAKYIATQ